MLGRRAGSGRVPAERRAGGGRAVGVVLRHHRRRASEAPLTHLALRQAMLRTCRSTQMVLVLRQPIGPPRPRPRAQMAALRRSRRRRGARTRDFGREGNRGRISQQRPPLRPASPRLRLLRAKGMGRGMRMEAIAQAVRLTEALRLRGHVQVMRLPEVLRLCRPGRLAGATRKASSLRSLSLRG